MRLSFIGILIFLSCTNALGQDSTNEQDGQVIDSLWTLIADIEKMCPEPCDADTGRIIAYINLGEQVYLSNPDSALLLWNESEKIARALLSTKPHAPVAETTKQYLSTALNNIGYIHSMKSEIDKALQYFEKGKIILEELNDTNGLATYYSNIGYIYKNQGDIPKALLYFKKCLGIEEKIDNKPGMANSYNNIGYIYDNQGDVNKALQYYSKSLAMQEEMDDKKGIATCFNNMGFVYQNQSDLKEALKYYNKALNLREEIGDKKGLANSYNNIGVIYHNSKDIEKALEYYEKGLSIREELGDKRGLAMSYNNIGQLFADQGDVANAFEYYDKGLILQEEIGDKHGMANSLHDLGYASMKQGNIILADSYATKAYKLSIELGYPEIIENTASLLKEVMLLKGDYKAAYQYYQKEIAMRDSVQNEQNYKLAQKQQARYEYQKQAAVDSIAHAKQILIKDLELEKTEEEKEKQKVIIYSFVAGFAIILLFSIIILRMFMQKKKANKLLAIQNYEIKQQKEEIETQRDEIVNQRDKVQDQKQQIEQLYEVAVERKNIVEAQKKEIDDSIRYAKRIQTAVLPAEHYANSILGEHFVIFRPHSVVSGDFYWATRIDDWTVVAVADCTGHGVPGAFMSMLGVSFLNEIVRKKEVTTPAEVLNHLRASIIDALKQTAIPFGKQGELSSHLTAGEVKDGMDMSIIAICNDLLPAGRHGNPHTHTHSAFWAGANNPLWIIRNREVKTLHGASPLTDPVEEIEDHLYDVSMIEEIKGDKMPVAVHIKMDEFTNNEISISKGDVLYLFTDGYPDQFGGPRGKKLKYKPFKRLLIENSNKSMSEQKEVIETALNNWMDSNGIKYEQVDDITVVGIRV